MRRKSKDTINEMKRKLAKKLNVSQDNIRYIRNGNKINYPETYYNFRYLVKEKYVTYPTGKVKETIVYVTDK